MELGLKSSLEELLGDAVEVGIEEGIRDGMAVRTSRRVCKDPNWVITSTLSSAGKSWKDMVIIGVCSV